MKAKHIEKYNKLRPQRLDPNHYTIALLNEGLHTGLIDQAGFDAALNQIMAILAVLIQKYTHGQSTSLKVETSQSLLLSIFYALDQALKPISDPADALLLLTDHEIEAIYREGLAQLEAKVAEGELLYEQIRTNQLPLNVEAYHTTIEQGLADFFHHYDLRFGAHNTAGSIDYPLLFDDMKVQGIDYIHHYLQTLQLENEFCRLFPLAEMKRLLSNYGRMYQIDYSEALINVFEIMLSNAIFSVLAGNRDVSLRISPLQLEMIRERFAHRDDAFIAEQIANATTYICSELEVNDPATRQYIVDFQPILLSRLSNALLHDCLENVVIVDQGVKPPNFALYEGKHLDDDSFRLLVEQIMTCIRGKDKATLVNTRIQSLADFIDILEAECFFDEEYTDLFNSLGDIELSILAKIVFIEELRNDPRHFSLAAVTGGEGEYGMEWQMEFNNFLQRLSPQRMQSIQNLI